MFRYCPAALAGLFCLGLGATVFAAEVTSINRTAESSSDMRGGKIVLQSVDVQLPADLGGYPGPSSSALNINCTACHSASMVLYQPTLSPAKWLEEVNKMRNTYGAQIDEADVDQLVSDLVALQRKGIRAAAPKR